MERNKEYNHVTCVHKLPNGLSAWQFQSEQQGNLNDGPNKVAIYVCIECGEISIGGYRTGADGSHNSFDETFNICYPDAIDAIIKQANFYNEEAKWCRADKISTLEQSCNEKNAIITELNNSITNLKAKCDRYEIERRDTRLALYMLIKAFRNAEKSPQQSKFHTQAEYILNKYHNVKDVLRNEALSAGEGDKEVGR